MACERCKNWDILQAQVTALLTEVKDLRRVKDAATWWRSARHNEYGQVASRKALCEALDICNKGGIK